MEQKQLALLVKKSVVKAFFYHGRDGITDSDVVVQEQSKGVFDCTVILGHVFGKANAEVEDKDIREMIVKITIHITHSGLSPADRWYRIECRKGEDQKWAVWDG